MNIANLLLHKIEKQDLESKLASLDTVGDRLRFLRKNYLKVSRAKLSTKIGIDASMLNKYENGYFEPKADRIKEFADFYEIPVEYITGENSDILLKEDYFLIANLHFYCWQIDRGMAIITNRTEIEIALYEANKIIVSAIDRLDTKDNEFGYISNLFNYDEDKEMLKNLNKDSLIAFFDKIIYDLKRNPFSHRHSLDYISRITDFGVGTLDSLTKKEYMQVIDCLTPLIDSYKNFVKSQSNEDE